MSVRETTMPISTILRSPKMSFMYQLRCVAVLTPLKELRKVRALSSTPTPERYTGAMRFLVFPEKPRKMTAMTSAMIAMIHRSPMGMAFEATPNMVCRYGATTDTEMSGKPMQQPTVRTVMRPRLAHSLRKTVSSTS